MDLGNIVLPPRQTRSLAITHFRGIEQGLSISHRSRSNSHSRLIVNMGDRDLQNGADHLHHEAHNQQQQAPVQLQLCLASQAELIAADPTLNVLSLCPECAIRVSRHVRGGAAPQPAAGGAECPCG